MRTVSVAAALRDAALGCGSSLRQLAINSIPVAELARVWLALRGPKSGDFGYNRWIVYFLRVASGPARRSLLRLRCSPRMQERDHFCEADPNHEFWASVSPTRRTEKTFFAVCTDKLKFAGHAADDSQTVLPEEARGLAP